MTPLAMFDVSLGECAFALLAAVALIKPEELPAALKAARSGLRKLQGWRDAATEEMRALTEEPKKILSSPLTAEELGAMAAHERYEVADVGAMDVSRRESALSSPPPFLPPEAEGMVDAETGEALGRMTTASDKIRYLTNVRGFAPKDVAAIVGKSPAYVYGVLRRDREKAKK